MTLEIGKSYKGVHESKAACLVLDRTDDHVLLLWLTTSGNQDMGDVEGQQEWTLRRDAEGYLEEL